MLQSLLTILFLFVNGYVGERGRMAVYIEEPINNNFSVRKD